MSSVAEIAGRVRTYLADSKGMTPEQLPESHDSLLQAGIIDSLGMMDLVLFLGSTFNVVISDDDLIPDNFETIDAIAAFVAKRRAAVS